MRLSWHNMKGYSTVIRAMLLMNWFKCQLSISRLELPITTTTAALGRGGREGRGRLERANLREGRKGREEKRGTYSLL